MSNHLKADADRKAKEKKEKQELFDKILCSLLMKNGEYSGIEVGLLQTVAKLTDLAYEARRNIGK